MGTEWHVSPIGGMTQRGRWRADHDIVSVTLVGGVSLNLSEAEVPEAGFTVTKVSLMGGTTIVVPPGVNVEVGGFSLVGGRHVTLAELPPPGAPTVRVRSYGIIGGIDVRT